MKSLLSVYSLLSLEPLQKNIRRTFQKHCLDAELYFDALEEGFVCFCVFDEPLDKLALSALVDALLLQCSDEIDVLYFSTLSQLSNIELVSFDMDSTLIQAEVIDELASYANAQRQVSEITSAAMRGEISFDASFERRIRLLKGIDTRVLETIAERLPFMPGLETMFAQLNALNIKTAIISGGFQYFADYLKVLFNVHYAFANHLEISANMLTGAYQGDILGPEKKRVILAELARQENIPLDHCMAVGDGANDMFMLQAAGIGVAFHAKPALKEKSQYSLDVVSLDALSKLLKFSRQFK